MEAQSSGGFSATSSESGSMGSGSGSGSGSGYSTVVGGGAPGVITAEDLSKKPPTTAQDVAEVPLTLSDQIAANFAALSGILGSDQTGGGAYPVPVPSQVATKSSSSVWIFALIGVAIVGYFLLKKGKENGE